MRIVLSGASGLVGSALEPALRVSGHEVWRLVRSAPVGDRERCWHPDARHPDPHVLAGMDAVVHLGGENIAAGRWTASRRERIRRSRVDSTRLLAQAMAAMARPPRAFLCASAVGIYGDRGDEVLTESSPPGSGFLAEVGREWEAAAQSASRNGIRVASLRFGVVLSPAGGALARMLPVFRLGLGGRIGNGRQYWSWISLPDAVRAIEFILASDALAGPVNGVSPQPLTNSAFTRSLAGALGRPAMFPLPAFAARLALGGMADAALLASARVEPEKLKGAGFQFQHATLDAALRSLLPRG
jgi:uncharacterized protein